jgi:hypothetical protein
MHSEGPKKFQTSDLFRFRKRINTLRQKMSFRSLACHVEPLTAHAKNPYNSVSCHNSFRGFGPVLLFPGTISGAPTEESTDVRNQTQKPWRLEPSRDAGAAPRDDRGLARQLAPGGAVSGVKRQPPTPNTTAAWASVFPEGVPERHAEAFMQCVRMERERAELVDALREIIALSETEAKDIARDALQSVDESIWS